MTEDSDEEMCHVDRNGTEWRVHDEISHYAMDKGITDVVGWRLENPDFGSCFVFTKFGKPIIRAWTKGEVLAQIDRMAESAYKTG